MKSTRFSYFGYGFKIKASVMHEDVINNQEHAKNTYEQYQEHSSIFKEFK